jgi:stress response protein SCP2
MEDGKQQEQTALMTLTLTNQEGAWKIAAAHNTLTSGPRYVFHSPATRK